MWKLQRSNSIIVCVCLSFWLSVMPWLLPIFIPRSIDISLIFKSLPFPILLKILYNIQKFILNNIGCCLSCFRTHPYITLSEVCDCTHFAHPWSQLLKYKLQNIKVIARIKISANWASTVFSLKKKEVLFYKTAKNIN